jgi:DNA polymerase-3 subunit beta
MDSSPLSSLSALNLHCDRQQLLAALQAADAVVPSNSTKPILTNLLLDVLQDRLEVVATDSQVGLRAVVAQVDVRSTGQAVVQARQIVAILKESSSAAVSLTLDRRADQSVLTIKLDDGDYQVPAIVGETFPPVSFYPADVPSVTLSGKRFEEMLRQTAFAMDKDRTSPVLSAMFISIGAGELVLAATDGKVLCEAVERDPSFNNDPVQAIIPALTIGHLQRIGGTTQADKIEIAFAGKLVFVRFNLLSGLKVDLTSRLVEGTFPSYRGAIAGGAAISVEFSATELASAVRRAALMTNQTSRGVVLVLEGNQAVLSNLNYTNGSARIPLACTYSGPLQKLGINSQYFTDVLRVFRSDRITIELSRGMVMKEPGASYLIMPIALPT